MVKVVKDENYEGFVMGIEIDGEDAQSLYDFLARINSRIIINENVSTHDIPEGTLIFEDELAVLSKLFQ